jgi:hypothetical protein
MRRKRHLIAAAILGALLAGPTAATATTPPHYKLDAYDPSPSVAGFAGPLVTDAPLTNGVWYIAEVEGTISYYSKRMWERPFHPFDEICGIPASEPKFRSPDVDDTGAPVGMDVETVFARPCRGPEGDKWPKLGRWPNFEINPGDGAGYRHITPTDGPHSTPSWSNAYDYAMLGNDLPAKFRLRDLPGATKDNYGRLDIYVRPASFIDCEHGIYRAFGFSDFQSCWDWMMANQDRDTYVENATRATARSKRARR